MAQRGMTGELNDGPVMPERRVQLKRQYLRKLTSRVEFCGDFLGNFRQGSASALGAPSWILLSMITSC
jgi:hypothetical protein